MHKPGDTNYNPLKMKLADKMHDGAPSLCMAQWVLRQLNYSQRMQQGYKVMPKFLTISPEVVAAYLKMIH
jgi:hypothetical protein